MNRFLSTLELLAEGNVATDSENVKVYANSFINKDGVYLQMAKSNDQKVILATGKGSFYDELQGEDIGELGKACPLTHENRLTLNKYLDYTVPQAFGTKIATIGLGDRLGVASQGHIETIKGRQIKPVLAQQSIRELTLTNRTMEDMLDAACFAVFEEGYKEGFGADGDHIKTEQDIKAALSLGVSMITLDCSDQIDHSVETMSTDEIKSAYEKLSGDKRKHYDYVYLNRTFKVEDALYTFSERELMKNVLLYDEAITYTAHVFDTYIRNVGREIDYEISIDETETITSPLSHFFVGKELIDRQVNVISVAPRFCGEFQKGIDYIGDIEQFEKELKEHAQIANHFGYKLSIHSGSDKFKVFPIIAKYTKGIFHIKTAGTNWLEAIRVIANVNPSLYREMHTFALEKFAEALKYYHVTPDLESLPKPDEVSDEDLSQYMNDDAARQLFHVTYGLILTAKNDDGSYIFKDHFFHTLNKHEDDYRASLVNHIGRHIDLLGL